MTNSSDVEVVDTRLSHADAVEVSALARAVFEADGTEPWSEDTLLAIEHGRDDSLHLLWRLNGPSVASTQDIGGYLFLGAADASGTRSAELCVAPELRGRGIGTALLHKAQELTTGSLRVWAHGDLPVARRLAAGLGFTEVRELRLMQLDLDGREITVPAPPDGVEIRGFRPGADEEAWLEVNALAFAHHPEQGRLTLRDLAERTAEPWFEPAGLLMAWDGGRLLGSHWTKVHPPGAYAIGTSGEVYVLGVRPDAGGRGLGRLLAFAGLRHLAAKGLDAVVLYVDGDNAAAVRLYESLGFRTRTADKMYESRESG